MSDQDYERWAKVLCNACGWKCEFQECTFYRPSLKVISALSARGTWAIGNKYILREVQADHRVEIGRRYAEANMELVSKTTTIPIPEVFHSWMDGGRYFLMTTRLPGVTLESCYRALPTEEIKRYAKETAEYIVQLRKLTRPTPGSTTGKTAYWRGREVGTRPEDMMVNIHGAPIQNEECLKNWPAMEPFTFTHVELLPCNIMIHDGHVSGIIYWDDATYQPVWRQYLDLARGGQWGQCVASFLAEIPGQGFPEAVSFFNKWGRLLNKSCGPCDGCLNRSMGFE